MWFLTHSLSNVGETIFIHQLREDIKRACQHVHPGRRFHLTHNPQHFNESLHIPILLLRKREVWLPQILQIVAVCAAMIQCLQKFPRHHHESCQIVRRRFASQHHMIGKNDRQSILLEFHRLHIILRLHPSTLIQTYQQMGRNIRFPINRHRRYMIYDHKSTLHNLPILPFQWVSVFMLHNFLTLKT